LTLLPPARRAFRQFPVQLSKPANAGSDFKNVLWKTPGRAFSFFQLIFVYITGSADIYPFLFKSERVI
jgi:hypothetical protein